MNINILKDSINKFVYIYGAYMFSSVDSFPINFLEPWLINMILLSLFRAKRRSLHFISNYFGLISVWN